MVKEFEKRVIGYEDIKIELERVLDMLKNPKKYEKLGVKSVDHCIITGPAGVGKSTLADAFSDATGWKKIILRKDKAQGDFVDEITASFKEAGENEPCVILCEDVDHWSNEHQRNSYSEEWSTLQSAIDSVKGKKVYVIATANETYPIPDSLLRAGRLGKELEMEVPDGDDAVKIVEYYLGTKNYVGDIDSTEIARLLCGRSCAELESVISNAGIIAAFKGKEQIQMDDMIEAILRVVFNAPESSVSTGGKFEEQVAYHECGHAVCGNYFEPGSISLISIKNHGGRIAGITSHYKQPGYFMSKQLMENRVISILGGMAATEIVYGTSDVGANSDIHRAMDIVERFIDNYCGYGFDKFERQRSSDELLERKETVLFNEVERYYQKAKQIIIEKRPLLDKMAKALVEKKTLIARDIKAIEESMQ